MRGAVARERGLSPRVRGNQISCAARGDSRRSIPACAGEPFLSGFFQRPVKVYPRVCGGTPPVLDLAVIHRGLSPRVRGNLSQAAAKSVELGSIPACAGEPYGASAVAGPGAVYPRVCGGTPIGSPPRWLPCGLSPRVRGNPFLESGDVQGYGSIPACAGEPAGSPGPCRRIRVYPRVCGGTR